MPTFVRVLTGQQETVILDKQSFTCDKEYNLFFQVPQVLVLGTPLFLLNKTSYVDILIGSISAVSRVRSLRVRAHSPEQRLVIEPNILMAPRFVHLLTKMPWYRS